MIQERARVLRTEGDTAWVQCESQAGCARCAEGKGCGGGVFARLLRHRLDELPVTNECRAAAGETVLIGLAEEAVFNGALLMYGLPLAGLLGGAIAGQLAAGEAGALLTGLAGIGAGLWLARGRSENLNADRRYQPVMLKRLAPGEPCPQATENRQ